MVLLIGLCLSALSSLIGFTALNIQRHAQRPSQPRPRLNMCGVLLNLLVGPTDMLSYTFAPQSLVAPVGTLSLVLNLVAAPRLHGDVVTRRDAYATFFIILGTCLCIIFGADGGDAEGVDSPAVPDSSRMTTYIVAVLLAGACLTATLVKFSRKGGQIDIVANALFAGLLASSTVVAGKSIGAAVSAGFPFRIIRCLLTLAGLAPTHLYVLNRGMGRHSSVVFVPLNVAASLLANMLVGFSLYGEAPASPWCFACGASVLIAGVLCLAVGGSSSPTTETFCNVEELDKADKLQPNATKLLKRLL